MLLHKRLKKGCQKGFTLIELLIVILIISVTASIVAPVAYRGVDKFKHLIEEREEINVNDEADYLSFIRDEPCKVENGIIVCGKSTFTSLKDVFK